MEKKVCTSDLKFGMYVSRLDRSWLESPFLFQGFHIRDAQDINLLRRLCSYVYIDPELGEPATRYLDDMEATAPESERVETTVPLKLPMRENYPDLVPMEEELAAAREIHRNAMDTVNTIMDDVRNGHKISAAGVRETAKGMIDSILRNPDAFMWLTKLKGRDAYTYSHALDVCTLAIAFGRHLCLPPHELEQIAIGALLFDIGKMRLPLELLAKPGRLTEAEFALVRRHVGYSAELIRQMHGLSNAPADIALTHHERHNGGGYPHGIKGEHIPLYGRLVGITDCYDAITSERPYSKALSPHEAIIKLYEWRNVDFQGELIEQFIQCLGVYPIGTLVELSTGEVGIVLTQNRLRRLRPTLMLILDNDKVAYPEAPTLDLALHTEDSVGGPLSIRQVLEPGAYGIDPREYYL